MYSNLNIQNHQGSFEFLEQLIDNFDKLFNLTQEGIVVLDEDNKILNLNRSAKHIFGFSYGYYIGKSFLDFVPISELKKTNLFLGYTVLEPYEITLKKQNNQLFEATVSSQILKSHGKIYRFVTVVDLSELKSLERAVCYQSKLASLGEMLKTLVTKSKQPLNDISTNITKIQLQKQFGKLTDEFFDKTCKNIIEKLDIFSHTIKTIDSFTSYSKATKFNLKKELTQCIKPYQKLLFDDDIELIIDINYDITLNQYRHTITQVVITILQYIHHIFHSVNIEYKVIFLFAKIENKLLTISIKDNTGGIENHILEKIFSKDFSHQCFISKNSLCLYDIYKIVYDSMEGSIEAINTYFEYAEKEYKGTKFTIVLPLY